MAEKQDKPRKWTFDGTEPDESNLPEVGRELEVEDVIIDEGDDKQKPTMRSPKKKYFDDDSLNVTPRLKGTIRYLEGLMAYITTREEGDRVATQLSKSQLGYEVILDSSEVTIPDGARVLVLNGETGVLALGIGAKFPKASVHTTDWNARNLEIAERNVEANHEINNVAVVDSGELVSNDSNILESFDVIVYNPGRFDSKDLIASQLELVKKLVRKENSRLYILTHKDAGLSAIKERIKSIFPSWNETEPVERGRGGFRVFGLSPTVRDLSTEQFLAPKKVMVDVLGKSFELETLPSLFSSSEIDRGSRLLVETVDKNESGDSLRVLDVGCGWGAIGLSWAMAHPNDKITMIDVDFRAVETTRKNSESLGLGSRASTLVTTNLKSSSIGSYDLVLSNPPFHAQERVLDELFQGVRDKMNKKANFWIVVEKTYLAKFEELMRKTFGRVSREIEDREGYYILRSQK